MNSSQLVQSENHSLLTVVQVLYSTCWFLPPKNIEDFIKNKERRRKIRSSECVNTIMDTSKELKSRQRIRHDWTPKAFQASHIPLHQFKLDGEFRYYPATPAAVSRWQKIWHALHTPTDGQFAIHFCDAWCFFRTRSSVFHPNISQSSLHDKDEINWQNEQIWTAPVINQPLAKCGTCLLKYFRNMSYEISFFNCIRMEIVSSVHYYQHGSSDYESKCYLSIQMGFATVKIARYTFSMRGVQSLRKANPIFSGSVKSTVGF